MYQARHDEGLERPNTSRTGIDREATVEAYLRFQILIANSNCCDTHRLVFDFEQISVFWANRLSFSVRKEMAVRFGAAGFDVTPKEWAILLILWREGTATPTAIAASTFRDKTTVSRLVERMVKKGLVERETAPDDRRKTILRPSKRALQLKFELIPIALQLLGDAQSGISAEDVEVTVRTLRKMTENLMPKRPVEAEKHERKKQ